MTQRVCVIDRDPRNGGEHFAQVVLGACVIREMPLRCQRERFNIVFTAPLSVRHFALFLFFGGSVFLFESPFGLFRVCSLRAFQVSSHMLIFPFCFFKFLFEFFLHPFGQFSL